MRSAHRIGAPLTALFIVLLAARTARAQHTLISEVTTDKAMYHPGDIAQVLVTLTNATGGRFDGSVAVFFRSLGRDVQVPQSQPVSALASGASTTLTYAFATPAVDFRGYHVEIWVWNTAPSIVDSAASAIDVSSDWKKFPRYGFLGFSTVPPSSDAVAKLTKYHLNGLQFYDVNWKHHVPYSPDAAWPNYTTSVLGNIPVISGQQIRQFIDQAHARGMVAMNYNGYGQAATEYAYWQDSGTPPLSGLFQHQPPLPADPWTAQTVVNGFYQFNPASLAWQSYIDGQMGLVFEHYPYDGWHIDSLGNFSLRFDASGIDVDLAASFPGFINAARTALPQKRMVFNSVDAWGQGAIAASADVDFVYSEIWSGTYKRFLDLVYQTKIFSSKPIVFPAYMNMSRTLDHFYGQTNCGNMGHDTGFANEASIRLTNSAILAAGGTHLEMGNGDVMVTQMYWPGQQLAMSDSLKWATLDHYNFEVAYENLLRDGVADAPLRTQLRNGLAYGANGDPGTVWTFQKTKAGFEILHLINLSANRTSDWRDPCTDPTAYPPPPTLTNLPVRMYVKTSGIQRVMVASPEIDHGKPYALGSVAGSDANGTYLDLVVPSLTYWTMVWVETSALSGTDYHINPYGTLEGEHYTDASGLGVLPSTDIGGGLTVANALYGRWARYASVDFGSNSPVAPLRINLRVASAVNGVVELRLDSPTGPLLASVSAATGGWQTWITRTVMTGTVPSGIHDLYAVFPAEPANLNWFSFAHALRPPT
jgi:dextranase